MYKVVLTFECPVAVETLRRKGAGSITIVVLPLSALMALEISGLKKGEAGPLLFFIQCETRAKDRRKLDYFGRHGRG